jgi:TatD DNase family protein
MIDTHCHLNFPDFKDDFDQVLAEAKIAGIKRMVNIGLDLETSQACVDLANSHAEIFASVGYHPHEAKDYSPTKEDGLRKLANNYKVVAIGEIGLDFYRDHSPREVQREVFIKQIALAKELGLPIVVHVRDAYKEAIDILAAEKAYEVNVVLHCFSGTKEDALRAIEYGFYLSVGGVLTFSNSRLPELIKQVPLDRILLETDAPFLAPHPHRGKRNSPAMVALVYQRLAEISGKDIADIEAQIDRNAEQFFEFE